MATDIDLDEIHTQVTARLRARFPEIPADRVDAAVSAELELLGGSPVLDYLEVLTERAAKTRLRRGEQAA